MPPFPSFASRLARAGQTLPRALNRFMARTLRVRLARVEAPTTHAPTFVDQLYARVRERTMTDKNRIANLVEAVRYLQQNGIRGAFVECGVWRGGSAMAMAYALLDAGAPEREIWLYDTFCGMTPPTDDDRYLKSGRSVEHDVTRARQHLARRGDRDATRDMLAFATLADVQNGMRETQYPEQLVRYVAGDVAKTLVTESPEQIALLRLDTDWYESTKAELEHLFDRVIPGGVLIIDDYDAYSGARKAVDEFLGRRKLRPFLFVMAEGRAMVKGST